MDLFGLEMDPWKTLSLGRCSDQSGTSTGAQDVGTAAMAGLLKYTYFKDSKGISPKLQEYA